MQLSTSFQRLAIDFMDGISHTSDGHIVTISDLDYLSKIPQGKTIITDIIYAKVDGKPTISIIAPIYQDGRVVAAARGTLYTESFGAALNLNFFNDMGYFQLINSKGEFLAHSKNSVAFLIGENYFESLKKLAFGAGFSAQQIKDDIAGGKSGRGAYSFDDMARYVEYMPVGISDWYMITLVPKWVIDQNASAIQSDVGALVLKLSLIALAVFLFILSGYPFA